MKRFVLLLALAALAACAQKDAPPQAQNEPRADRRRLQPRPPNPPVSRPGPLRSPQMCLPASTRWTLRTPP